MTGLITVSSPYEKGSTSLLMINRWERMLMTMTT